MFEISDKTKVYIVSNPYYFNGGGELLHQLCDALNNNGIDSYMCYFDIKKHQFIKADIPDHIKLYNTHPCDGIEDNECNIIIVPEKYTEPFKGLNRIQKCIWWLGMNQYFWTSELYSWPRLTVLYHWLLYLSGKATPLPPHKIKGQEIRHLSQCWYGVAFLNNKGFHNVAYLSDYINELHLDLGENVERENIVLYNPKRNIKYLKKVMKYDESIKYIPIINMSNQEVSALMARAKLYVDLGSHPGKDRMPREAALHGCCIITSTEGSADFWDDVPIGNEFKFVRSNANLPLVHKKIMDVLNDYDGYMHKFDSYREFILKEKGHFEDDVKNIFSKR